MKNMMKDYLGNEYSNDHFRNFCLYWIKGMDCIPKWENTEEGRTRYDMWRKENDMDCLYLDGDLRADTLISAWTPIKWVIGCINKGRGIRLSKTPDCLKHLLVNIEDYLPPDHELARLLNRYLELAEGRWNIILLPDRKMNCERYTAFINGKKVMFYDEVPVSLYHIFRKESLGKFFLDESGEVDENKVKDWIRREHLEMGFVNENPEVKDIIPLIEGLPTKEAKCLTEENEIKEALIYMIDFLEKRKNAFTCTAC
ncbi:MAG: hypothetical protein K6E13_08955 [Lachnospiraceae bacterium]|nr:hypothetical protein [Lachnospiraceae bacterium]